MEKFPLPHGLSLTLVIMLLLILVAVPTLAWERKSLPLRTVPTEPITYTGDFTLLQSDGAGCNFSDAPVTAGSITFTLDWIAGTATASLQGGGTGTRVGLRCGNTTGDMIWSQSYSASFTGSTNADTGAVTLNNGTLNGSNVVFWQNCETAGEPVDCPPSDTGAYFFPVTLQGTFNTLGGSGHGTWQVNDIPLPTSGTWTATGPALTATPTATDTSTATPTATPTATSTSTPIETATATATPVLDLTVKNIEVVQVIQCLDQTEGDTACQDNSVPLVSFKQTAVRVYLNLGTIPQPPIDGATAQLRGFRDGQELADSPLAAINSPIRALNVPQRGNTNDTLNFRLPFHWSSGLVELEVEVNPAQTLLENNYSNNTLRTTAYFQSRLPLDIAYIPIVVGGTPPSNRIHSAHNFLFKRFPVGQGQLSYRPWPALRWDKNFATYEDATALLAELHRRYLLASDPVPDQLAGWVAQSASAPALGISHPLWGNGHGRVSWQQDVGDGDFTLAHEIAHNMGRRHTNRGDGCRASDNATDWRYDTSTIQEYGFDPTMMQVIDHARKDVMTYCSPPADNIWMSPYSYRSLFDGQWLPLPRARPQAQDYLLVSGVLYASGGGQFEPAYRFSIPRTYELPRTGADYCLLLQDDTAQTLATYCFDADFHNHRTGALVMQVSYALVVPYPPGTTRVVLQQNQTAAATLTASAHAPTVTITTPAGGETWTAAEPIHWQASDADSDGLTYAVLYSADNKATWLTLASSLTEPQYLANSQELAGGDEAYLRVLASDGFNTSVVDSPAFHVTRKSPQPVIFWPAPETEVRVGQPLVLTGDGYDLEDGALADERFRWSSDQAGALGTGRSLLIEDLVAGQHVLTLETTDSEGNIGAVSVQITIRTNDLFLPLVQRN